MIELVNTSLPNGLLPGSHGFATVAMTRGTPDALRTLLEGLSSYVHRATAHDVRYATDNPVAWHHVAPPRAGHVLSRVAACDFDYTGRTNRLARHWQVDDTEWPSDANAARILLSRHTLFEAPWTGQPRWLPPADVSCLSGQASMAASPVASRWVALYGEKGRSWAEKIALELRRGLASPAGKPLILSTTPAWDPDGTKLLGLFADLIDLIPERFRGRATFSTYAAVLPGWVPCALRGLLPDDPALGPLTAGRPWFDAVAGVLHGEEFLPAEVHAEAAESAAMRPAPPQASPAASAASPQVSRSRNAATGGAGMSLPRGKKSSGAWFFAVLGAVLLGTTAFLLHVVLGGDQPPPLAPPEGEMPPPAETAAAESAETDENLDERPVLEAAATEPEPEPEPVAGPAEPEPPPRLWEGAVWRSDRPLPGEKGVTWWYYSLDRDELVEEEGKVFGDSWKRPEFQRVRLWKDGQNRVFWDWDSKRWSTIEITSDGPEELNWLRLMFGPDKRVWEEWNAETREMARRVRFNVEFILKAPPCDFTHEWSRDVVSENPVSVASLWNEAWTATCHHLDAQQEDLNVQIEELNRKKESIPQRLEEARTKKIPELQARLEKLDEDASKEWERRLERLERELQSARGTTAAEKRHKEALQRQLEDARKSPLEDSPKQKQLRQQIKQLRAVIDDNGAGMRAELDAQIEKLEQERANLQRWRAGDGQAHGMPQEVLQRGRMRVTLEVVVGEKTVAERDGK